MNEEENKVKQTKRGKAQTKKVDIAQVYEIGRGKVEGQKYPTCEQVEKVCKPDPVGINQFKVAYKDGETTVEVLPIQGMGCVIAYNDELVYVPGARFIDGLITK